MDRRCHLDPVLMGSHGQQQTSSAHSFVGSAACLCNRAKISTLILSVVDAPTLLLWRGTQTRKYKKWDDGGEQHLRSTSAMNSLSMPTACQRQWSVASTLSTLLMELCVTLPRLQSWQHPTLSPPRQRRASSIQGWVVEFCFVKHHQVGISVWPRGWRQITHAATPTWSTFFHIHVIFKSRHECHRNWAVFKYSVGLAKFDIELVWLWPKIPCDT